MNSLLRSPVPMHFLTHYAHTFQNQLILDSDEQTIIIRELYVE